MRLQVALFFPITGKSVSFVKAANLSSTTCLKFYSGTWQPPCFLSVFSIKSQMLLRIMWKYSISKCIQYIKHIFLKKKKIKLYLWSSHQHSSIGHIFERYKANWYMYATVGCEHKHKEMTRDLPIFLLGKNGSMPIFLFNPVSSLVALATKSQKVESTFWMDSYFILRIDSPPQQQLFQ